MEIEKKYLAETIPFDLNAFKSVEIVQSYISASPTIRLRKSHNEYMLTVKGSGQIMREEFELSLTQSQYEKLLLKTENSPVEKTRYFIPLFNNLVAELDIYHKNLCGLITVEVEFTSMAELNAFIPPYWFGKDVSQDTHYKNTTLSIYGIPPK